MTIKIDGGGSSSSGGGISFEPGTLIGDVLMKTGATEVGKVTNPPGIPESLIVPNETISTFTAKVNGGSGSAANVILSGTEITTLEFDWTYSSAVNPATQTLTLVSAPNIDNVVSSPGLITPVTLRHDPDPPPYTGLTMTILAAPTGTGTIATYRMTSTFSVGPTQTKDLTIQFKNNFYVAQTDVDLTAATDADIVAASTAAFFNSRPLTHTFTGGTPSRFFYFVYPKSGGPSGTTPPNTTFGGFAFTDFTRIERPAFDNGTGFTEDYIMLKTNSAYAGSGTHTWVIESTPA